MDGTEIAAGSASLMSAVQNLRKRANEATVSANTAASANDGGKDDGDAKHRPVDIVRKLDLLQKLSDASNGSGGGGGGGDVHGAGEELSLQDRVFHSMVLEKLPDFSKLGPSALARGVASGPSAAGPGGENEGGNTSAAPSGGAAAAQMQLERQQAAAAAAARKTDKKSWANRPGAKRNTKGGKAGGLSEVKEIVIPLGPERLSNIEIHRILKNEFAVRYCETLNIAPTAANVSDINRRMPLSQCVIRQVIHPGLGRGERKNYVSIIPPCYKPLLQREATRRQEEQRASLGLEPDVDPRDVQPFESMSRSHQPGSSGGDAAKPSDSTSGNGGGGGGAYAGPIFEDYKHRFVHPFNLASRFEADPDSVLTSTSTLRAAGGANSASAQQQAGGTSRGGTFGRTTAGSLAGTGGHGDMRRTARAARNELDESQTVEQSRKAAEHQRRVTSYDDALAKLKRGEKLDAANVDSIRKAVADERPLAVTAAHIQALDDMLGAADDDGVQQHSSGHRFHLTHNATHAPTAPPRSAGTASIANARVHAADPRARQADAAAQREVDAFQHPSGIAEVRALQSLFIRDFPFGSYFADKDEIVCLKAGLSADDVTDVVVAMLRFLFSAYIAPRASEARSVAAPTDVDDAFVSFYSKALQLLYTSLGAHPEAAAARSTVQKDSATTTSMAGTMGASATAGTAMHGARSLQGTGRKQSTVTVAPTPPPAPQSATPGYGVDDAILASASGASPARLAPMIVLLCRVAIDKELRSHVPTLLRSPAGSELAVCIDNLVMAILDPLNLLSHISVVESTPHAMRILQSKRRPGRIPPMLTSPLTHFVLGEPQSANAKTMARSNLPRLQRGLKELQKHLTPLARSRLLQAMVTAKFGGDSTKSP